MIDEDSRLQAGAYVSDGAALYEVRKIEAGRPTMGIAMVWVVLENCRDLREVRVLATTIKRAFSLVRLAPTPRCPDRPGDIAWSTPVGLPPTPAVATTKL